MPEMPDPLDPMRQPHTLVRLTRDALSLALDAWLWLINAQMLVIGLMGRALRRLSEPASLS